jgi:creatinine amidohydrolase
VNPVASGLVAVQRLIDLRGPQVATRITDRSVIVQPLGAVEQHGPHLPLSTDLVIAEAAADAVAERAAADGLDVWLLPALAYTKSNEHAWSSGTVWLSALNVANRELRLQHGLQTFLAHPSVPPDQGGASTAGELGMGIHGGIHETAMMLHLRPDLVDTSLFARAVPERLADNRHVRFGGTVSFGWLSDDFGPSGAIGDPTGATAELGRELFDGAIDGLVEAMHEIAAFEFGR